MKHFRWVLLLTLILSSDISFGQINFKKKAEKKTDQAIDNLLFGKKKKKKEEAPTPSYPDTPSVPGSGSNSSESRSDDDYKSEPVDWDGINYGESVDFNTLINMLPERTNGFNRSEKPEGAKYSSQGFTYSTGIKTYEKGGRELRITLSDYLGAEYLVSAQTTQYEYESTDGYVKSFEGQGMSGWLSMDYDGNEGTIIATKAGRFLLSISIDDTGDEELKAIFNDIDLSRLPGE